MLFLSCVCYVFAYVCLLMSCGHLLGKGCPLGSRLSNCEFVTFPLVSWVQCGTGMYRFLILAHFLTLSCPVHTLRARTVIGYTLISST